jgi:hypothetical protein
MSKNVSMNTIFVRKQHPDKNDEDIKKPWCPIEDVKRPATYGEMRKLVQQCAQDRGHDVENADEVNVYVKNNQGQLEVVEDDTAYAQHAGQTKFYAYVPDRLTASADRQGGGGNRSKLVCGVCLFLSLSVSSVCFNSFCCFACLC